jgi:hypothetical protein
VDSADEWKQYKLESLENLRGLCFEFGDYKAPGADWDHDHCEGCGVLFADAEGSAVQHAGFFTTIQMIDKPRDENEFLDACKREGFTVMAKPASDGVTRVWVCQKCFEECREALKWQLKSGA